VSVQQTDCGWTRAPTGANQRQPTAFERLSNSLNTFEYIHKYMDNRVDLFMHVCQGWLVSQRRESLKFEQRLGQHNQQQALQGGRDVN
jgi:hypothetical protein